MLKLWACHQSLPKAVVTTKGGEAQGDLLSSTVFLAHLSVQKATLSKI